LQKAVEELVRAQARLEHARRGAATKEEARDAASRRRTQVEEELQVSCGAELQQHAACMHLSIIFIGSGSQGLNSLML
jgi:hypothetical protein